MHLKILWILDSPKSALSVSAHTKFGDLADYLYIVDFASLTSLARKISMSEFDVVIFCLRQTLKDMLESSICIKLLLQLPNTKRIVLLIPDCIGADPAALDNEWPLFQAADAIFVTSEYLFEIYQKAFSGRKEVLKLIDSVAPKLLEFKFESVGKKAGQVVWIGNSQWGNRQGYIDHKGLESVVKPLVDMCAETECEHTYVFIDSSVTWMEHSKVIEIISRSEYLIQASQSEGTGMPLLESLLCKTVPISTSVGIAPEVLKGDLAFLLTERSPVSFFRTLHDSRTKKLVGSSKLLDAYKEYANQDPVVPFQMVFQRPSTRFFNLKNLHFPKLNIIYIFRYMRNKIRYTKFY